MRILSINQIGDGYTTPWYTYLSQYYIDTSIKLYGLGFRAPSIYGIGKGGARIYKVTGELIKSGSVVDTNATTYTYSYFDTPLIIKPTDNYFIGIYGEKISVFSTKKIQTIYDDIISITASKSAVKQGDSFGNVAINNNFVIDISFEYELINSYFIKNNNQIKASSDGINLTYVDNLPYTNDKFDNYGMNDLSKINSEIIDKLVNDNFNIAILK